MDIRFDRQINWNPGPSEPGAPPPPPGFELKYKYLLKSLGLLVAYQIILSKMTPNFSYFVSSFSLEMSNPFHHILSPRARIFRPSYGPDQPLSTVLDLFVIWD